LNYYKSGLLLKLESIVTVFCKEFH
jgi:hypothetical protein